MVSLSIILLLIFSVLANYGLGTESVGKAGSKLEDVPCEEDAVTPGSPPTVSTITPTKFNSSCGTEKNSRLFKRKNGYWCSSLWTFPFKLPLPYRLAKIVCEQSKAVLSSMETEDEVKYYTNPKVQKAFNLTAFWVEADYNNSTKQYFWNDGHAVQTMDLQPIVKEVNGKVAWVYNKDPNVAGNGNLQVVEAIEYGIVDAILCGTPVVL